MKKHPLILRGVCVIPQTPTVLFSQEIEIKSINNSTWKPNIMIEKYRLEQDEKEKKKNYKLKEERERKNRLTESRIKYLEEEEFRVDFEEEEEDTLY